jgi:hypothetical protein
MNNVKVKIIKAVTSQKGLPVVGLKLLAKRWKIGIETAHHTLEATTQTCTTLHPTLSRRYQTNGWALRYRRLSHEVYTDTMKAKSVSFRQNKYAQVFCMRFGWTRIYPMRLKSEAHLGLLLTFQRDGVSPSTVMDGSEEQTMGQFRVKAREANFRSNKLSHILYGRMQQSLQSMRPSVQLVDRWPRPNARNGYGIIALNWKQ